MVENRMIIMVIAIFALSCPVFGEEYGLLQEKETSLQLHKATERAQQLSFDNGGWTISVQPGSNDFAELVITGEPSLPNAKKLNVQLDLSSVIPAQIKKVNIRLVDANGEVHSIEGNLDRSGGNSLKADWKLSPGMLTQQSWGKNTDQKLDFPVRLTNLAVAFAKNSFGSVTFGTLSAFDPTSQKVLLTGTYRTFTSGYDAYHRSGNTIQQKKQSDGIHVVAQTLGKTCLIEWRGSSDEKLDRLRKIIVYGKLLSGKAQFQLRLFNPQTNEWNVTEKLPFTKEGEKLIFDLSRFGNAFCEEVLFREINLFIEESKTEIVLDHIDISQVRTPAEALDVNIPRKDGFPLFTPDEQDKFKISFFNRSEIGLSLKGDFSFRDMFGRELSFKRTIELAPGTSEDWKPFNSLPANGVWKMDYKLTASGGDRAFGSHFFGFLKPSGIDLPANPRFSFGVCNHWITPEAVKLMSFCGVRAIRSTTPWFRCNPQKDEWDFQGIDVCYEQLKGTGIKLRKPLAYTPPWAAQKQGLKNWRESRNQMPQLDAWREYVSVMAKRYGDRNEFYEIWNEPDLHGFAAFSAEEYAELQKVAYEAIKTINPKLIVSSGGFATVRPDHNGGKTLKFQEDALRLTGKYFDLHSYHEHGSFTNYPYLLDRVFLPMREKYHITQPWIASETAISSSNGTEVQQAETLFKKLIFAWSRGAIGYTWYNLINYGINPADGEMNFGLVTKSLEPKYVFGVYNMLTTTYREANYLAQHQVQGSPYLFSFRIPSGIQLAHWNQSGEADGQIYFVKGNFTKADSIDTMGNVTPAPLYPEGALMEIGRFGGTLRLTGSEIFEEIENFALLELPSCLIPGQTTEGRLKLHNFQNQFLEITLKSPVVHGIPSQLTLKPNEQQELPVQVSLPLDSGNTPVFVEISGKKWPEPLVVTSIAHPARLIPPDSFDGRGPDFRIDHYENLVTPWENDPATAHLVWRDKEDLSADIWLGRTGSDFLLRIDVTDDIHFKTPSAANLWEGDSIQFALGFAGQNGYFEMGGAGDNNTTFTGVWVVPLDFHPDEVRKHLDLKISRQNTRTRYDFRIPWITLGGNDKLVSQGIRFNLIVNDNDGVKRKGWLQIAPGIGRNQTIAHSPVVLFR